ncbi:MAG TPA: beta-ketoacyl-ACP synthase III [Myxococcales bacterium]|nr:beta-ketoacyl-ACP synthase III [Myxococcales bacterium]
MPKSQIVGTGSYVPDKVLTNRDLEKLVETSDQWIVDRTGIRERRVAAEGEAVSDMAVVASRRALEMAGLRPEDLDLIIVGTISADMPLPSAAAFLQAKLGAKNAAAFDVAAACAGSLYGMSIADKFIAAGASKRVLVVGVELLTRLVDWSDRNTCVLFGDAAGAMVMVPSEGGHGILSTHLHTDGTTAEILYIPAGGSRTPASERTIREKLHCVKMNGREVYRVAVRSLTEALAEALAANKATAGDLQHVISHQANLRILEAVLKRFDIPMSKCWINLDKYGNTSSASLPMTLDEANRAKRLKSGDLIAMMAIGAGMAWGSALVRW